MPAIEMWPVPGHILYSYRTPFQRGFWKKKTSPSTASYGWYSGDSSKCAFRETGLVWCMSIQTPLRELVAVGPRRLVNWADKNMTSAFKSRLQRTLQSWHRYGLAVVRMDPLGGEPFRRPLPIFEMTHPSHLDQFALGCDSDMGGFSTVQLAIQQSSSKPTLHGVFRGVIRTELNADAVKAGILKSGGYAGFRTKVRTMLIGEDSWNAEQHEFLRLRVKNSGDGMKYFVNIQTEGPASTDIFQHRLWLGKVNEWQDVLIPFADFALRNKGQIMKNQFEMPRDSIRTVGISVLEKPGPYELGVLKVDCSLCTTITKTRRCHSSNLINQRRQAVHFS
ncbi:hypothetical protein O181_032137 [Austropuccinia psidii MF-1]|uniref:NADH:ubiquinone oxidoreductase intermediate-associated protein 30 domain-containing protein n=1 Tax=Austropuccinia psidii MF-1 TaxID=1389203 RepID=A0A9Q3D209_9BASI|nr:hypothetical protein [Austropuccinia psidii MF-1]